MNTPVCPWCRADLRRHCDTEACPWWRCRICLVGPISFDIHRAMKTSMGEIAHIDWPHTLPDHDRGTE